MRITYRDKDNQEYWTMRWKDLPADHIDGNTDKYPLKYAVKAVEMAPEGTILEAGCGAGRVIRYFHARKNDIEGFDFIDIIVERLKKIDATLKVITGDITNLEYKNNAFSCVLAFGMYHNLPMDRVNQAFSETRRVMTPDGVLCFSFRADNLTTRITDWLRDRKSSQKGYEKKEFHKINLTEKEIRTLMSKNGFDVLEIEHVENMPVLYKFKWGRHKTHREFNESLGRKEGYRLNWPCSIIQRVFKSILPGQACNVFVIFAKVK